MTQNSPTKSQCVHIKQTQGKSRDRILAEMAQNSVANSAMLSVEFSSKYGELDLTKTIAVLSEQVTEIHNGDMRDAETLLYSQARTLDTLFMHFALLAKNNAQPNIFDTCMRLALKSQNQCRSTLQTLSDVKNPRPYIQNNSAEYQQVNNSHCPSRARKKQKQTNELLEDQPYEQEWMDGRAEKTPVRND